MGVDSGYINSTTSLRQFVHQYDNALAHKVEKENETNFTSLNTIIPCGSQSLIERQFQSAYTHAKFAEVQTEFRAKMNCIIQNCVVEGDTYIYEVMEESINNHGSHKTIFKVNYNRNTNDFN